MNCRLAPEQRRRASEIDVIGDHHPSAGLEIRIGRAGGVGEDQLFDARLGENANDRP